MELRSKGSTGACTPIGVFHIPTCRFHGAPTQPNATMWGLATHPADANRILAFSLFGEVYISEDAGESWRKIAREFGEIRTAVWVPN